MGRRELRYRERELDKTTYSYREKRKKRQSKRYTDTAKHMQKERDKIKCLDEIKTDRER